MVSICTGGKTLTVLLVLPSISASASIAFRWAVGFAFYAMEHHHDPRTEAVGARRCRLGHMLRRFQPLFCGRRHAQPFLCVGERAGGRARGYRGRHAARWDSMPTCRSLPKSPGPVACIPPWRGRGRSRRIASNQPYTHRLKSHSVNGHKQVGVVGR